jgi:hypothetical protein
MYIVAFDPIRLIPLYSKALAENEVKEYIYDSLVEFVDEFLSKHSGMIPKKFDANSVSRMLNKFIDLFIEKLNSCFFLTPSKYDDRILRECGIFNVIPSDTRFPLFFSSLADHAVSTSAIALATALHYYDEVNFSSEYSGNTALLLSSRDGLKAFVRFASIFHDLGKPGEAHNERSAELLKELVLDKLLTGEEFNDVKRSIIDAVKHHHYGKFYEPPSKRLEWIIAFSDKVSAADRLLPLPKDVMLSFIKLIENVRVGVSDLTITSRLKELLSSARGEYRERYREVEDILWGFLSPDPKDLIRDEKLVNAERIISNMEGKPVSILVVEIGAKQQFITRSGALKDLQGSSIIIDLAIKAMSGKIREILGPESVMIDDAGELIAIVPTSMRKEILYECINAIPEFIRECLIIKSNIDANCSFSLAELKYGPRHMWSIDEVNVAKAWNLSREEIDKYYIDLLIERDRVRSFGSAVSYAMEFLSPIDKGEGIDIYHISKLCNICGLNLQEGNVKNQVKEIFSKHNVILGDEEIDEIMKYIGEEKICAKCLAVRLTSFLFRQLGEKKYSKIIESLKLNEVVASKIALEFIKEKTINGLKLISSLDDYDREYNARTKGKALIALIHGDGDNFGSVKSSCSTITQYRFITRIFRSLMIEAIKEGVKKVYNVKIRELINIDSNIKSRYFPFLLIYAGGDDFLAIVEAPYFLKFLEGFRSKIREILGYSCDKYERKELMKPLSSSYLGISVGISIASYEQPLYALYSSSKELEGKSKNLSKQLQHKTLKYGSEIVVSTYYFRGGIGSFNLKSSVWPLPGHEIFEAQNSLIKIIRNLFVDGNISSSDLKPYIFLIDKEPHEFIKLRILYDYSRSMEGGLEKQKGELLSLARSYFINIHGRNHLTIQSLSDVYDVITKHFSGIIDEDKFPELIEVLI